MQVDFSPSGNRQFADLIHSVSIGSLRPPGSQVICAHAVVAQQEYKFGLRQGTDSLEK